LSRIWLIVNEEIAYKKINCTNAIIELINIGNYCIKLYVNGRTKSGINNWIWERGSRIVVIRMNIAL
jgi:hypothetical protein